MTAVNYNTQSAEKFSKPTEQLAALSSSSVQEGQFLTRLTPSPPSAINRARTYSIPIEGDFHDHSL
jgi:hypothetical protein